MLTAGEVFVVECFKHARVCVPRRRSDDAVLRAFGVPPGHSEPADVVLTAAGELLVTCGCRDSVLCLPRDRRRVPGCVRWPRVTAV